MDTIRGYLKAIGDKLTKIDNKLASVNWDNLTTLESRVVKLETTIKVLEVIKERVVKIETFISDKSDKCK